MPPRQGERRERVRRQRCVTPVAAPAWRRKPLLAVVLVALLAGLASGCSSKSALGSAPSPGTVPTTTTPSPQSSSAATAARLLEPDGIGFWNRHQGLLVETVTTPACRAGSSRCRGGQIDSTTDGGRTWTATDRVPVPLKAVATAPGGAAWVETGRCGAASPDACTSSLLLVSADGGRRWWEVHSAESVTSVSPVSSTAAWAVPASRDGNPTGPRQLVYTDDGGQRWQTEPSPCSQSRGPGTWAVDFTTPRIGWVLCAGEPATDMQAKALYVTTDAGRSWRLRATTPPLPGQAAAPPGAGRLPLVGYLPGLDMTGNGTGWMWADRRGLSATRTDGQSWTRIASGIVNDDANAVLSASLLGDQSGFLLINQPLRDARCGRRRCGPELLATTDDGQHWTTLRVWASA